MPYTSFFDNFPKLDYDIQNRKIGRDYEKVTDIFIRIGFLKDVLNNISSYVVYEIEDGDTPEILAEKVYGDAGAGWMIIYANQIYDPQFDWPLDYSSFQKYIVGKYGSIENAKTTIHHYEKVITRTLNGNVTTNRYQINKNISTNGVLTLANTTGNFTIGEHAYTGNVSQNYANADFRGTVLSWTSSNGHLVLNNTNGTLVINTFIRGNTSSANGQVSVNPYDATLYDTYDNLEYSYNTYDANGKTIIEEVSKNAVDCYTWEDELNENKRTIKVIKAEYYPKVMTEFDNLVQNFPTYIRRVL